MKTIEELNLEIKSLSKEEKEKLLEEKAQEIRPMLDELTSKNFNGYSLFYSFILGSILADGKLSFEEATMVSPFFKSFFHDEVSLDEMRNILLRNDGNRSDYTSYLKSMLSIIGDVNYVIKEDILTVCLITLSSDTLTDSEIEWLKQIY